MEINKQTSCAKLSQECEFADDTYNDGEEG